MVYSVKGSTKINEEKDKSIKYKSSQRIEINTHCKNAKCRKSACGIITNKMHLKVN